MVRQAFRDPKIFWAYVGTKLGVLAIAALATWPLARNVGPKAWIGLAVFAGLLAVLTLAVLFGGSPKSAASRSTGDLGSVDDDEEALDPDAPVKLPVEDFIDLHPFPPRDVPDVVDAYLEDTRLEGSRIGAA